MTGQDRNEGTYREGVVEGYRRAIEALRDRATVDLMAFADAALYLESITVDHRAEVEE